jgi:predicted kinase
MEVTETQQMLTPLAPVGTLHLVCGKIGSGKSTLTCQLAAKSATVRISEDEWLAHLYPDEIHALTDYVRCSSRLRDAMAEHVAALLVAGTSVVLDFPSNTVATRGWARGIFEQAGADHCLHYLDTPEDVCKARLRARNLSGAHPFETTDEEFAQITRHFVAPTTAEGFHVVRYD